MEKMESKLIGHPSRYLCLSFFFMSIFFASSTHAVNWAEQGDASELTNTAQIPIGSVSLGSLTSITGVISTSHDADLYKIHVDNPVTFSASVSGSDDVNGWDSVLALFDSSGIGVYQNDDRAENIGDSVLPSNHVLGPNAPGIYYLSISDDDSAPLSGNGIENIIFPIGGFPYTQVVGPTGEGGGLPLNQWGFPDAELTINGHYNIALTGASFVTSVPEPESYALFLAGLSFFGVILRRRKASK